MEFQHFNSFPGLKSWLVQKELSADDARLLHDFVSLLKKESDVLEFNRWTEPYFLSLPSLSDAQVAVELLVDLILLNRHQHIANFATISVPDRKEKHQLWLQELRKARFSETTKNDAERETKIKSLPWPSQTKLKVERRGDRHGVEIRFFVASAVELKKTLAALERVQNDFPV